MSSSTTISFPSPAPLFVDVGDSPTVPFASLNAVYAIDNSGSTGGSILRQERASAEQLAQFLPPRTIIAWNQRAEVVRGGFSAIKSMGMTVPSTIVPLLPADTQCLVLYTDGHVHSDETRQFQTALATRLDNAVPMIVIFTMSQRHSVQSTVKHLERQINMSIPEACLSLTSHACVVVNIGGVHKVLMSSGVFYDLYPSGETSLEPTTQVDALPDFDMTLLSAASVRLDTLPAGTIRLNGFKKPLSLEVLYTTPDVDVAVLEALADRVYFAKLDVERLRSNLLERARLLNHNPEVLAISEQLAELATDPQQAGGERHRALLVELQETRRRRHGNDAERAKLRTVLARLLAMLAAYTADATSIALGSNRAIRAKVFGDDQLEDVGECVALAECPVMLTAGDTACLLLRAPAAFRAPPVTSDDDSHESDDSSDDDNTVPETSSSSAVRDAEKKKTKCNAAFQGAQSLLEFCTRDIAMEAPFYFGSLLRDCVTPGLYSLEFARVARTNPFTREPVIGYVPLSKDPTVIMRHMSKLFGASRELWHFVRAYIGMVTAHVNDDDWAHRTELDEQMQSLLDRYDCTYNLKGGTNDRRPLRACLEHVLREFGTCLRDRLPNDSRTIMLMADTWLPALVYPKVRVEGMLRVVEEFALLLAKHKKRVDMRPFVMDLDDEYKHHVRDKAGVRALIARLLWRDACAPSSTYRGLKLQTAVNTALHDRVYGERVRLAFAGHSFVLESIAAPEPPRDDHFGDERFGEWTADGRSKLQCVYCGVRFYTTSELFKHLHVAFGRYYYNGQCAVQKAIAELTLRASDAALFRAAKEILYRHHGQDCAVLHTQHCKRRLLQFIRTLREQMR